MELALYKTPFIIVIIFMTQSLPSLQPAFTSKANRVAFSNAATARLASFFVLSFSFVNAPLDDLL